MKNKCYGCKERVIGCHSFCLEYKKFREKLDDENRKKKEDRERFSQYWTYTRSRKEKI